MYGNINTDNINDINKKGFINQKIILDYVTEEEIFELVFGFLPKEYQYVTSPLREDKNPGCFFEKNSSFKNRLRFVDYADNNHNKPLDCFDMVQLYFKLPNFYETLKFIYDKLIVNKNRIKIERPEIQYEKIPVLLNIQVRNFTENDANYWKQYGVSKQNLIDDLVFPIKKLECLNSKKGNFTIHCYTISYAYTEFDEGRKKIYFPKKSKEKRFITNCIKNDIGGLKKLSYLKDHLIITKSYKDWRVLTNLNKNCVWFQNEGMIPEEQILIDLVKKFPKVIVWFDNDNQGIISSQKISNLINSYYPGKSYSLWLPEKYLSDNITDPSDLIKSKGKEELQNFINLFT